MDIRLTEYAAVGGCSAKIGPGVLDTLLSQLPRRADPRLVVGYDGSDDAAVYQLEGEQALVQTVDFFPPMVDDPYTFGQVAAANALSDIYAMGAVPKLALNLLCFPSTLLPLSVAGEILAGGCDKVHEAGAVICGGHSIEDREPKYGLCVTGFAPDGHILTNAGARPGDLLLLTKPLGAGILTTAAKAGLLPPAELEALVVRLTTLNKYARDAMMPLNPHACTDITGFGLMGHGFEMAQGSGVTLEISAGAVPYLAQGQALAEEGYLPGGAYRNRSYLEDKVSFAESLTPGEENILFDPQTSGGLLLAVAPQRAQALSEALSAHGCYAQPIGKVLPQGEKFITVTR